MTAACPVDNRPQAQGLLCHACTSQLEQALRAVPTVLAELDVTLAKLGRTGPAEGSSLARERSGYHAGASQAHTRLLDVLVAWARGLGCASWYATTAAAHLLTRVDDLRAHPDADLAHTQIVGAVHAARRTTDTPTHRTIVTVGPCPEMCDGRVRAYFPVDDRPPHMACTQDPEHRWDATQWLRVGRRILAMRGAA